MKRKKVHTFEPFKTEITQARRDQNNVPEPKLYTIQKSPLLAGFPEATFSLFHSKAKESERGGENTYLHRNVFVFEIKSHK